MLVMQFLRNAACSSVNSVGFGRGARPRHTCSCTTDDRDGPEREARGDTISASGTVCVSLKNRWRLFVCPLNYLSFTNKGKLRESHQRAEISLFPLCTGVTENAGTGRPYYCSCVGGRHPSPQGAQGATHSTVPLQSRIAERNLAPRRFTL